VSEPLLSVRDLSVAFHTEDGEARAVDGVSLDVAAGEVLALVGESGSGKSVTALALMGLTAGGASVQGSARYRGTELVGASGAELRRIRGAELAMVFQDPLSSLNPVMRVADQISEQIAAHEDVAPAAARERAVGLLGRVGIPRPQERAGSYPHELSGGMRQRVMIAMALSCRPRLLIADEPTTALDVTVQAQILDLIRELRGETGAGVLLVTHDLAVVAELADRVAVMYAGRIVEQGTVEDVFDDPRHPYTWGLLGAIPRLDQPRAKRLPAVAGAPPPPTDKPAGCHFRTRCPHELPKCVEVPAIEDRGRAEGHPDRCWLGIDEKRSLRMVDGRVGLRAPVEAAR
jgi:peptide/nickel transport system ATP-binding protein/oligopeptide transport system ATP-binding protein